MRQWHRIVEPTALAVQQAVDATCDKYAAGQFAEEPSFTDRMLGAIEDRIDGLSIAGLKWRARTTTSHGFGSEERRLGADFVGVLDVELEDEKVRKGFLAQAKRADSVGGRVAEFKRLRDQCDAMLKISPAAFVFVYSPREVRVIPAIAISSTPAGGSAALGDLYSRSVSSFFELYLECFVGDRDVAHHGDSMADIARLLEQHGINRALLLELRRREDYL